MADAITNFSIDYFPYIKFVHVFFAFLWGLSVPPAYSVFVKNAIRAARANPGDEELQRREYWAWDQLDKLIVVEHIAWPVLIITGPILFLGSGWQLTDTWLMLKLLIIVIVYVPLEAHDIWFTHVYAARAEANKEADPEGYRIARERQLAYFRFISLTVRVTIPVLYFLAIVKPG